MSDEFFIDNCQTEKWKNKYTVSWCHQCDTAIIICPECKNISCSGGGCSECIKDNADWNKVKTCISDYLTKEDFKIYQKGLRLQTFIKESIAINENQIDWQKAKNNGEFSQNDLQVFHEFLSGTK